MATYTKASRLIPSNARSAIITAVVAGNELNFVTILGRPARQIKIVPDDSTDSIEIRLNNRIRMPTYYPGIRTGEAQAETPSPVYVVSKGSHFPLYTLTGETAYLTESELDVYYLQVEDITFGSGGTEISIICW